MTKSYTLTNVRHKGAKTRGTARRDWFVRAMRNYPDAHTAYKTRLTPYRYEPQHMAEQSRIDKHTEETGDPGIPVDVKDLADRLEDYRDVRVWVTRSGMGDDAEQVAHVSTSMRSYEVRIDPDVVDWHA